MPTLLLRTLNVLKEGGLKVEQLFYPKSVVVIGVSERPDNLARNIVENLFEFQFNGEIHLIGRKEGILFGRRILTSMDQLPGRH